MSGDTGSHYRYVYKGVKLDPARICLIYEIKNMLQATIAKKALCAGNRGHKDAIRDIDDIITAANRWKEILIEDAEVEDELHGDPG